MNAKRAVPKGRAVRKFVPSVTIRTLLPMLLVLLLLVACGGKQSFDAPPNIVYGADVCSACNMIINEENFASAYWTADGDARMFDDLGEMILFMHNNPDEEIASAWVHDMNTAKWLRADNAWIVMNAGIATPMGTGMASLATEEDARALAFNQEGAMVMSFDELMEKLAAGHLQIQMGGGHGGMNGGHGGMGND